MILLFDIGNTRIKWRFYDKEQSPVCSGDVAHQGAFTPTLLDEMWGQKARPERVLGVNVFQPQINELIKSWCLTRWNTIPSFVESATMMGGVTNGYHNPEQLGADRWVAMIGASHLYNSPCCIADCGTAVTIDCLDQERHHLGGFIVPGLTMMPACVIEHTTRLKAVKPVCSELFGRDTGACLASGAVQSIVALLQHVSRLLQEQSTQPVTCVITGGDARQIKPWLGDNWHHEPELLFTGLLSLVTDISG